MALKDNWVDLEDAIEGIPNSGDDASAETINKIAHAVIELEDEGGSGDSVDLSNYYTKDETYGMFVSKSVYILERESMQIDINKIATSLNNKANKSTTLAGYGILDAYTQDEVNALIAEAIGEALEGDY